MKTIVRGFQVVPQAASWLAVCLVFGAAATPVSAQSPGSDIWASGGLPSLQGSWQGHPTPTKCTGVLAGFCTVPPGAPSGTTPGFYSMTTYIPTGIAYATPLIPNATTAHGRWRHIGGANYLHTGQIFIVNNMGVPVYRAIAHEFIIVNSPTTYVASVVITVYDANDTGLTMALGSLTGVSHNTRFAEPAVENSPPPPPLN